MAAGPSALWALLRFLLNCSTFSRGDVVNSFSAPRRGPSVRFRRNAKSMDKPASTIPVPVPAPRHEQWRGFLLDEARHFFGKESVKSLLERMAEHGLDVFHWHLTDDQGWRIDLPGMPDLVRFGARRPSSPPPGEDDSSDGTPYGPFFYTEGDIRDRGDIAPGQVADLVLLDSDLMPVATLSSGRVIVL